LFWRIRRPSCRSDALKPRQGWTPLHIAAREGRLEVARLLLEGGADIKAKNDNGKTALDLAMNEAMRKLLRRNPAEFAREAEEMRRRRAEAERGDKDRAALAVEEEAARRASEERKKTLAQQAPAAKEEGASSYAALKTSSSPGTSASADASPMAPTSATSSAVDPEESAKWAKFEAEEEARARGARSAERAAEDDAAAAEEKRRAAAEDRRREKAEREEEESRRAGEALERMRKAAEEKRRKFARDEEERKRAAAEAEESRAAASEREQARRRGAAAAAGAAGDPEGDAAEAADVAAAAAAEREQEAARKRAAADAEARRAARAEADAEAAAARRAADAAAEKRAAAAAAAAAASYPAAPVSPLAPRKPVAAYVPSAAAQAAAAAAVSAVADKPRTPEMEEEMRKAAEDLDLVLRSCRLDEAAEAVERILSVETGRVSILALKGEWEGALVEALGPARGRADIRIMQLAALRALVGSFTPALGGQRAEPIKVGLRKLAALLAVAEDEEARIQAEDEQRRRVAAEEAERSRLLAAEEERRRQASEASERRRKEAEEEERKLRAAEEAERSGALIAAADANDARAATLEALSPAVDAVRARLDLYGHARSVASQLALLRSLPPVKTHGEEIAWFAEGVQATQAACDASARQLALLRDTARRAVESGAPEYEVALAAAERDRAEEAHRASLVEAARLLKELSGRQRSRAALIHEVLSNVAAVNGAVGGAEVVPIAFGDTFKELPSATVAVAQASKDLAARLLPAEARTQAVAAQLLECLAEEAAILEALEGPVEDAISAAAKAACSVGGGLAAETPDADAAVAESLAAAREADLDRLRALEEERALAAAAREALAKAKQSRDEAWVELEDLKHERKKAVQLQRPFSAAQEDEYVAAVAAIRARVAAIEADIRRQEEFLRSAAVRECFPELAREAGAARLAVPLAPSVSAFTSRHQFEEVKTLRLTPGVVVTRVKELGRPEAPDHVLKEFSDAESGTLAELQRLAGLRHPLVAPLEGAFAEDGAAYCVMPYYRGGALRGWVDELRERRGALRAADWAAVRRTFRQLLQALAHAHGRGIAHRDVKPENVFWQDDGRLAPCDFGVTAVLARKLDATRAAGAPPGAPPVAGYAAPEACGLHWNEALWTGAGDLWSVGVMALELVTGELHAWEPARRRLEAAADRPLTLPKGGDKALGDFVALALALTAEGAGERPTAGEALLHPFFTAAEGAPSAAPAATKLQAAQALLGEAQAAARRRGAAAWSTAGTLEPYVLRVGLDTLVEDVLRGHLEAPEAALGAPWHAVLGGARAPLAEVMARFFEAVTAPDSRLLERSAAAAAGGAPPLFLPVESATKAPRSFETLALGRVLGKCLVEGINCGVEFAPVLYACLLGGEARAFATPEGALAHLAAWDRGDAARLRAILLRRLGTGNDAALTVGSLLGNGDGALLCDFTKRDVLVKYCAKKLVERRRDSLDAMARGFAAVVDAVGLGGPMRQCADLELGALLFGGSYVDVEALKRVLVWDAAWPVNEPQVPWLSDFLGRLTEPALRVFVARCTGRLQLRSDGGDSPILVLRAPPPEDGGDDAPRLPGGNIMQLPAECVSYASFEARLRTVMGLAGEYATVSRLGLGLADTRRLVRLLAPPPAVTKVFECPNAHLFGVGPPPGGVPPPPEAQGRCPECNALASAAGGAPKAALAKRSLGESGAASAALASPKYGAASTAPGSPTSRPPASMAYGSPLARAAVPAYSEAGGSAARRSTAGDDY